MGLNETSNVGIEGEKIGIASRWLGSPSRASLVIASLSFSRCSPKEFDLGCFLRDPFLRGFELYLIEGLLSSRKFKLFPKSVSKRSSLISTGIPKGGISSSLGRFLGIDGLGLIAKLWD